MTYRKLNTKCKNIIKAKKKGFTLIELVGVIAIMGILVIIFSKNITGYIDEAKKTKVIEQSRRVVMAVDTYEMRKGGDLSNSTISQIKSNNSVNSYIGDDLANLSDSMSVANCRDIVNGIKDFSIDENGIFNSFIDNE
ncbi:type II secretion system protein [Clostridium sp.]|uniref:type II secretion system protein n=1 Tax=Clostridium sp. TaxID=1506 RepID=UPI0026DA7A81|nr:type II secretion system protein [Clostridium sp.]MDO5040166.1 type II secretion system protein [Clostridium sp.]